MVSPLSRLRAVIDKDFKPLQVLQLFSEEVARLEPIRGAGSPEGVVDATQWREYIDTTGTTGSLKYIKQFTDIGGNTKQGWVLL